MRTGTCVDCSSVFEAQRMGPVPKRCASCRARHQRATALRNTRDWRVRNHDRARELDRAGYRRLMTPERIRRRNLWQTWGLTEEARSTLVDIQRGGCAICGIAEAAAPRSRLHIDHDHETGVIRGLLCHHCNSAVGHMKDDPARLRRAADYLELGR